MPDNETVYTRIEQSKLLEYQKKAELYDKLKDTVNSCECMLLVELFSSAFQILSFENLEKITSTKLFTIKDDNNNSINILSIMVSRFDRYATHIGFVIDENNEIIEDANSYVFYIMPNEDFSSDTCNVKELTSTQTKMIKACCGDNLTDYVTYLKNKVSNEN